MFVKLCIRRDTEASAIVIPDREWRAVGTPTIRPSGIFLVGRPDASYLERSDRNWL